MTRSKWLRRILVLPVLFLSSCAVYWTPYANFNSNTTQVELRDGNYTIVGTAEGKAEATYILGIGGFSQQTLMGQALSQLYDQAHLQGKSKAVVYLTPETRHTGFFPFFYRKTIIIKGFVVEFKESQGH